MSKTRQGKMRRKLQRLATLKKMTKKSEIKTIRIMKLMFRPLTNLLSPALRRFFPHKFGGKIANDSQYLLYKLVDYNLKPLSSTRLFRNGNSVNAVDKIIRQAIRGRNVVCHSVLPEIKANSKSFLTSWIQVAHFIGDKKVALKLKQIHRYLSNARKFPRAPSPAELRRSMVSVFRKLELDKRNRKWSETKEMAANAIEDVLFDAIAEDFAVPMRGFMTNLKLINHTSTIDSYLQLKIAIDKCEVENFVAPQDGTPFDMGHLQVVMDSRHSAIHEQHHNTLRDWQKYFKSLIYVSLGIGSPKSARMISRLYDSLVAARKEARREIRRVRLSPILRNQDIFVKGKPTGINSRWLGKKSAGRKHLNKGLVSNSQPGAE